MDIYLLRSAIAADDLHLSLEGRQVVRALGNKVRLTEEPSFDRVVTCAHVSCVQTAELFADRVDYVGLVEVLPALANNVPPQIVTPLLLAHGTTILVVGEEPSLSALGAFLIGRPTFPPLVHAQLSLIRDRRPEWCMRPGELGKSLLLVA